MNATQMAVLMRWISTVEDLIRTAERSLAQARIELLAIRQSLEPRDQRPPQTPRFGREESE